MNDIDNVSRWIDEFSSNEISASELPRFVKLMESDDQIRKHAKLDHELERLLFDGGAVDMMRKIRKVIRSEDHSRRIRTIILIAATLLVLVVAGGGYLYSPGEQELFRNATLQEQSATDVGNPDSAAGRNLIAGSKKGDDDATSRMAEHLRAFRPNPEMEALVGITVRSSGFLLQKPNVRETFKRGEKIKVRWTNDPALHPLQIAVFDRDGTDVIAGISVAGDSYDLETVNMAPGRYYWKMLLDDNLVRAGVFVLR